MLIKDYLISGTTDGYLYIWDLTNGKLQQKFDNEYIRNASNKNEENYSNIVVETVDKISYNEKNKAIVYTYRCGYNTQVCFVTIAPFDAENKNSRITNYQTIYNENSFSLSDNGEYTATKNDSTIYYADINEFDIKKSVDENIDNIIKNITLSQKNIYCTIKNDGMLYINADYQKLYIYDTKNHTFKDEVSEIYKGFGNNLTPKDISWYSNEYFFANNYDATAVIATENETFMTEKKEDKYTVRTSFSDYIYERNQTLVNALYFPDKDYILMTFNHNEDVVCIYNRKTYSYEKLFVPDSSILSSAINADGEYFAIGTNSGNVFVYKKSHKGFSSQNIAFPFEAQSNIGTRYNHYSELEKRCGYTYL